MNIILIGCRGAGKTAVGKRLAARLQRRFVDTDHLLEERQGIRISDLVESHGWNHFRAREKRIIEEISKQDQLVIAPGGGAVLETENVMALKKNGLIVWLKAKGQVLLNRMKRDPRTLSQRPTLTGKGTLEEIEEVMAFRRPFYEWAADLQIDTSTLDVERVVGTLVSILQERIERA